MRITHLSLLLNCPKTCAYWKWPEVQSLVKQYSLVKFRVDGCAVDVVDHAGAPLLQSWCVASNVVCVSIVERHLCDGKHEHGMARGKALSEAENYTPLFASTTHEAWRDECMSRRWLKQAKRHRRTGIPIALPCVCVDLVPPKMLLQTTRLTYGRRVGNKQQSSRSCPDVRVDYVPRTEGRAMSGGWTPWEDSWDDALPSRTTPTAPPNPPPRIPCAQPAAYILCCSQKC